MVQLVIKRESWWSTPFGKQVMIWVPVAGVQAATLAGLGYFYDRLSAIELYNGADSAFTGSVRDVSVSAPVDVSKPPPVLVASIASLPVSGGVSMQPALETNSAQYSMQAGESFSIKTAPVVDVPVPMPVADTLAITSSRDMPAVDKAVSVRSPRVVVKASAEKKKRVVRKQGPVVLPEADDIEARRTAAANLSGINVVVPRQEDAVPVTTLPTINPNRPFNGELTPVGIVTWIYIGELREYGWHGQKLHVPPRSGLPEIGRNYRTQKIHGLYEQPYGKRVMAGFQQGDTVTVLEVRQEANNKVWAKVRKVRSYGR